MPLDNAAIAEIHRADASPSPAYDRESGHELLDDVQAFVRHYVVLTDAQAAAVALWITHTHAINAFEVTPFLAITSPEKQCGKSRLLEILRLLVARPWSVIMPSEAVLFRKIASERVTLLLDETDAIFHSKNPNVEPTRAVLNAGNRRGTSVPRCVGPKLEIVDFEVFGAKALAGIGKLPDTISDRAVNIRMARKRPDEKAARFRRREAEPAAEALRLRIVAWAETLSAEFEAARPAMPDVLDDRAEEAWEPLLAIADLAGGAWPARARHAAVQLSGKGDGEEGLGPKLLADLRDVFEESGTDTLSSASLAAALCNIEESPWGGLPGKPLDSRGLATRLKPFEVRPRSVRLPDGKTPKGYRLEQFEDAFVRYLAAGDRHTATTAMATAFAADSEPFLVADETARNPASAKACGGVADPIGKKATRPILTPGDAGYPLWASAVHRADHITESEHDSLLRWHRRIWAHRVVEA